MEVKKPDGEAIALKILKINKDTLASQKHRAISDFHREILLQSSLNHPNIVHVDSFYFFLEIIFLVGFGDCYSTAFDSVRIMSSWESI